MARGTVYNSIVNEGNWSKVNPENKKLLEEFLEYCQSTDKSALTVVNYRSDIKICFCWSLQFNSNKFFIEFSKRDFMKYQNYLLNTLNLSPNRIRRLRSSISSMSNFIESMMDDEFVNYRPIVNKIPAPVKEMVREKTILSDEQVQLLLDTLVKNKEYDKACVVALAACSGSRKSELLRFKVSYFKDEYILYGSLYKTPEKIKTKGRGGKLGKQIHKFVLYKEFSPYFNLWMEDRREKGIPDEIDDLFVKKNKNGDIEPIKISMLDSWTKRFSKILGVDFYFHCERHYFTTHLSQNNIPDGIIKDICGWESLEMVNVYKDITVDDELGKYFGEDGIKKVEKKGLSDL